MNGLFETSHSLFEPHHVLRIGHRGAAAYAPENSLASIQKALEMGVDAIELDVRLSRDGVVVVIHDDTIDRTSTGKGEVAAMTLSQLKQHPLAEGQTIPTLGEVLQLIDGRATLFIELKCSEVALPAAKIVCEAIATKGWSYRDFWIIAFEHASLLAVKTYDSKLQTGALLVGIPISLAQCASEAKASALLPNIHHCHAELVDDAHGRGLQCFVWTANTAETVAYAKSMKVDGIISDKPDLL
jgi:glycerophosphoryl diester phosphodiesterase